jgi:hypothetical protein
VGENCAKERAADVVDTTVAVAAGNDEDGDDDGEKLKRESCSGGCIAASVSAADKLRGK